MRIPDRGNDTGGIIGIRRCLCKRFLCREGHDKKGAADPGMDRKCAAYCDHGILAVPAGVLCYGIHTLRRYYLAGSDLFNTDAFGDAVADIYAFCTEGGKTGQRSDLPCDMDHIPWQ